MGWPSIENEFSAWSPRPWNKPFESAVIPGAESVINELIEEEALSSGSCSNKLRSTSVCSVDVVSNKSSDDASTVTVLADPARLKLIFRTVGTEDLTLTSCVYVLKPDRVTVMW